MNLLESIQNSFLPKKKEISFALAGGGCKALFALGVGERLKAWGVKIKEISGVSAGAAVALMIISDNEEAGIEYFEELLKRNKSNFHVDKLFTGKRPFPHETMYRRTIRYSIDFEKIRQSGVKIYISAVKAFPKRTTIKNFWNKLNLIPTTMRAVIMDDRDKEKGVPHSRVDRIIQKWNLKEILFTEKDLSTPEVTEQIILNSSSIPPVLSFQKTGGEYYLDGGLTNNLLIEHFSNLYKKIAVYYEDVTLFGKAESMLRDVFLIRPNSKLPIETFDYTNSIGARLAFEMGREEAEKQKSQILKFLEV
ncbi:MAG: patatin-like phospholipase family protein [Leptospiraceae bacterium]|nr:patatin-like phospholipase family protein [Leptospiraceae bacterium]